jgi:hypothetical protein
MCTQENPYMHRKRDWGKINGSNQAITSQVKRDTNCKCRDKDKETTCCVLLGGIYRTKDITRLTL